MSRKHRAGIEMEKPSTEVRQGQSWKHRWAERTVRVVGRSHTGWTVESEGRANYAISEYTLKRDYRLVA